METGNPAASVISMKESWCIYGHMARPGRKQVKAYQLFETLVSSKKPQVWNKIGLYSLSLKQGLKDLSTYVN